MKKLVFATLIFILAACSAGKSELAQNRQAWENAGISHYRFVLNISCYCSFMDQIPLTMEVKNGKIVSMTAVDGSEIPANDPNLEYFRQFGTIDELFVRIEEATAGKEAGEIVVNYDSTLGFPSEVSIDYIKQAVDDELYVSVTEFNQLP